jgi:transposase InsO family protein
MSKGKGEKAGAEGVGEQRGMRPPGGRGGRGAAAQPYAYPVELKIKAVKLHLEEGLPVELIGQDLKVHPSSLYAWVKRYRRDGEAGLQGAYRAKRKPKIPPAVKAKITELKQRHPGHGVQRIAQLLRRVLLLPGSAETVRRTLHGQQLIVPPKHKPKRNPPKPRFFERSTPNQLWQSDIFTFRLNSQNAYLIGFIDDHSRYVTGLGVYRGQTAENVLEVYRQAVGEYGLPKEMLTDNGRQYASWHGKTRFQMELAKDRIHHLRSAPHHPMTLGKIERFWKTIWEEFLERARFDTFESAQERIRYWVKYYNHQRPHQGIEGLCPADRFFSIQKEVRQVVEKGIEENVQELALRGQPKTPFYMVGRVGEKSVIIRAERGDVRMQVEGEEIQSGRAAEANHDGDGEDRATTQADQCAGEVPGGSGGVGRSADGQRGVPADGDPIRPVYPVAGGGDGGYALGSGADAAQGGTGPSVVASSAEAPGEEERGAGPVRGSATSEGAGAPPAVGATVDERGTTDGGGGVSPDLSEVRDEFSGGGSAAMGGSDRGGVEPPAFGHAGCSNDARQPQDLLSEGSAGVGGNDRGADGEGAWTPAGGGGRGAELAAATEPGVGGAAVTDGTAVAHPGGAGHR